MDFENRLLETFSSIFQVIHFGLKRLADRSFWRGMYVDRGVPAIIDDNMDALAIGN